MAENKGLNAKIGNIQKDIESLVKDEKNKNLNYKYFEESQILKVLKPLLEREKLTLKISDDDTQPLQWDREGNKHFLKYLKKMEVCDQESKETEIFKFWACGDNINFAQAKGAAETYAMKYMLSKFFLIRVVDEDDPELKETNQKKDEKAISLVEIEKKQILEKVILKNDNWYYCKRCEDARQEPFKLIEKHPNLKLNELKEALLKHGEL